MDKIDFRSDTVTWPTPAMRQAMANAPVGDDVYGEDPTINQLEEMAAAKLGKEAGLFVSSGTMGNLISILSHATRGDEAIVGEDGHTYKWEAGGMASLGGIVPHPLPTDEMGRMDLTAVTQAIRPDNPHLPHSRLILVENSYGERGGYPIPLDYFAAIRAIADQHGLAVHMDGARLFNAAVALGVDASHVTQHVDSVSFCLSKGLCAPVGSLLCGSADFIHKARRVRKSLGGGMRQAGILAAAGLIALDEMVERLADDHASAQRLAQGLAQIPGIVVDVTAVKTNIVFFSLADDVPHSPKDIIHALRQENIYLGGSGPRRFRAVTHYWVREAEVDKLLHTLHTIVTR
ncbi:MAG: low-specificity L-threonine aldolase [Ardenticatenaceae bacterium]|nr:low-specificity L-threonine aldolase [Anaerolineales bacterium]MCB8920182.1 low-specificity L-threonine aldolase [Ardenticatenaceae bacterium]